MSETLPDQDRIGVLLFNLGGPETLEEVRPFLFNLFSDPDIIRLPWRVLQKPLAWLISTQRYRLSRSYYEKIGGGSPLRRITDEQARALEQELARRGIEARAYVGMRYWHPFLEDAIDQIRRDKIAHLIVLPLYPQFSISTTGSSLNRMNTLTEESGEAAARLSVIEKWHDDSNYIDSLANSIREELEVFPDEDPSRIHIVFSAHSVPVRYIEEGDPYLDQTQVTVRSVMERLGTDQPHSLSFQSKVGPVKWLRPSTDETIRNLAREGVSQVLLVPVSFVSEHIETLYELDILYRNVAEEVGIAHYRRVPALNCRPDFVDALAGLVQRAVTDQG
ncbi:MAG TPA: ferrochelatase [Blastocatellia bacterium]|nr:ferrochelatase [Blastocatellia bacterium]